MRYRRHLAAGTEWTLTVHSPSEEDERAAAARLELWAHYPEQITVSALGWLRELDIEMGSVARQVGWTRLQLSLGACPEAKAGLALLEGSPEAGEEHLVLEKQFEDRCGWTRGRGLGVRLQNEVGQPLSCRATLWISQPGGILILRSDAKPPES